MLPGQHSLTIYRGDTNRWKFLLWADVEKTEPVDLSGVVVDAEIRDKSGGCKIATIECEIETPNIINALLTADASNSLPRSNAAWDLQLTYPNDDVSTVLAGRVTVIPDITGSSP
jgi:hypothetical protein